MSKMADYGIVHSAINDKKENQQIFSPVENGICIAEYEGVW